MKLHCRLAIMMLASLAFASCGVVEQKISISSISPSAGTTLGGTQVTITGKGLDTGTTVDFGLQGATVTSAQSGQVIVTVPSFESTGAVDVTVTNSVGNTVTRKNGYDYVSMLVVVNRDSTTASLFNVDRTKNTITPFAKSPFATNGLAPQDVAADVANGFVFIPNGNSATLAVMQSSAVDGTLTMVGSPVSIQAAGPVAVKVDPLNLFAFTADFSSNQVTALSYDATSGIAQVVDVTSTGSQGIKPMDVGIDPGARILFVANSGSGTVSSFTYDAAGNLTDAPGSPVGTGGATPTAITVDPLTHLIFIANQSSNTISVKSYNADGSLNSIAAVPANGTAPTDLIVDIEQKILFVANAQSNTITFFTYASDGTVTGSALHSIDAGGRVPSALGIDSTNSTLYVANANSNTVQVMTYDSKGALTRVGTAVDSGGFTPYGIAFIP